MQVVPSPLILKVRVSICGDTLSIVKLHVYLVGSHHVKDDKVHNSLLPSMRGRMLKVIYALFVIFFNFMQGAFM